MGQSPASRTVKRGFLVWKNNGGPAPSGLKPIPIHANSSRARGKLEREAGQAAGHCFMPERKALEPFRPIRETVPSGLRHSKGFREFRGGLDGFDHVHQVSGGIPDHEMALAERLVPERLNLRKFAKMN